MSDDGYTLAETLVALAAIALAMSGLSAALQVLAQGQRAFVQTSAATDTLRRAQTGLERLFAGAGPFRSDGAGALSGDDQQFAFGCSQDLVCKAQLVDRGAQGMGLQLQNGSMTAMLPLHVAGPAHFEYGGSLGIQTAWPPAANPLQVLRTVAVVRDDATGPATILQTRLWVEEAKTCAFDVVLQDCR